jgi:putative phosphoribosyl transferase
VAEALNQAGLGTLLFDLLTRDEEADRSNVFDIELLSRRLIDGTAALASLEGWSPQPIGYFGASTGAAAALWAASELGDEISAVVSRGGRPDLAMSHLGKVTSPTLLIVGSLDTVVLGMNRTAQAALTCENRLDVVPGASHLFEEPGALDTVAGLARDWFLSHLETRPTAIPVSP